MKIESDIAEEVLIDKINDIPGGGYHHSDECDGNLSFWNPGREYKTLMKSVVKLEREEELFDYRYAFTLQRWNDLQRAFGVPEETIRSGRGYANATTCSSVSIVLLLQTLERIGVKTILPVGPYYYSVRGIAEEFGMEFPLAAQPFEEINSRFSVFDSQLALWITSPIYGSGEPLAEETKQELHRLHDAGAVLVFDESLALPGTELCREFPIDDRTFFIYSPHKAIAMNSLKFSAIVCDSDYTDFIDNRQDVYVGALANSNIEAMRHFLDGNFKSECVPAYLEFVENRYREFAAVVKKFPFAHLAEGHSGHYHNIRTDIPLPGRGEYMKMLTALYRDTGCIFYPSDAMDFVRKHSKLVFRVNLLTDRNLSIEGTRKTLQWMGEHHCTPSDLPPLYAERPARL